jgi:hypothetical protein
VIRFETLRHIAGESEDAVRPRGIIAALFVHFGRKPGGKFDGCGSGAFFFFSGSGSGSGAGGSGSTGSGMPNRSRAFFAAAVWP